MTLAFELLIAVQKPKHKRSSNQGRCGRKGYIDHAGLRPRKEQQSRQHHYNCITKLHATDETNSSK